MDSLDRTARWVRPQEYGNGLVNNTFMSPSPQNQFYPEDTPESLYANLGKVNLNPSMFARSAAEAGEGAAQIGAGIGAGVGISVGRTIGGILGDPNAGAMIGSRIGRFAGGPLGTVVSPVATALGAIASIPVQNPLATMTYIQQNDPAAYERMTAELRNNPLSMLSLLGDMGEEARAVREKKRAEREANGGDDWALMRDLDYAPTNLGETVGQLMGGLMLLGNMTQRGLIGMTSRAQDFKNLPQSAVSPELQQVWQNAKSGKISDEQLLDELVMAGQPIANAEGNIGGALLNLGFSIFTDPLLLADFGTGIIARSGATAARTAGGAFFRSLAEKHGTEIADQITGNLYRDLSSRMSPGKLDRMMKSDTVTNELFLEAVKQGIDPEQAAITISQLPKRQQLAMQLDQGQRLTGVYQVVKAVNFNFAEIGIRNNSPLMNAHLSSEATRGGANAFGIDNYIGMQDFAKAHGMDANFNQSFGIFIGNMGRGTAGEMLADDVLRTNLVPMDGAEAVRPTQVIEDRLARGFGQSFGHWVEAYIRRRKKDFVPVGKQTREQVLESAREQAVKHMHVIYDNKIADDAVRAFIATADEDMLAMIHAQHYGRRVSQVKEAIRKAIALPTVQNDAVRIAHINRVTYIGADELTRARAEALLSAIEAGDIDEVKRAIRQYDDLARMFVVEGYEDRVLMDSVKNYLDDHMDDLVIELTQAQLDELPGVIRRVGRTLSGTDSTLGLRPESVGRAEWRMKYNEGGRLISTKPWLDAADDVAQPYNPATGIGGLRIPGVGTLGSLRDKMLRDISTERIFFEAKKSFVSRLVEDPSRKFTHVVTVKQAEDLFGSVMRTASEMGTTPRGMGMAEIKVAAEKVEGIGKALAEGTITPRDLQDAVLLSFEGGTLTVGATQKLTGKIKSSLATRTGHNALGEITERLYPNLKFGRWAFFFQAQEAVEPYAFAMMRGIRIGVEPSELDEEAQRMMNRYMASNEYAKFDFMERSMSYLWGNQAAFQQAGGVANEVWAEGIRGKFQRVGRGSMPARAKVQAQRRMYREFLGKDMKRRFDAINPLLWHRLEVRYSTLDSGEIAMRWLREADVWASGAGEVAMSPLMAEAARPLIFGNTAAVDFDRIAKRLISPTSKVTHLTADIRDGKITFGDFERELTGIGATPEYIQKAWVGANFDPDEWWDAWTQFGYSAEAVKQERRLAQVRAEAMGLSEREFMAQRVRGVGPVTIGAEDFAGLTPTEWDSMGLMFQMASDPTLARLYGYGGRVGKEEAQVLAGRTPQEIADLEAAWLDRAYLRDPVTGAPKGTDQARIIKRMGEEATAMEPLERINLGGRWAYIPGGEAALRDPDREWTVWEAQVIRSQMINPKDVTISDLSVGLYRRMWKAHDIDLQRMDTIHHFMNNIGFAMFSPNMNLTRNEMINTRFRVRGFGSQTVGDPTGDLEQSADTILGMADHHDRIVSTISATKPDGVDVTMNEIGFARGTEIGNYVPVGAVQQHIDSGSPRVAASANQMASAARVATDYLRTGYRKKHVLKTSPMLQWLGDIVESGLKDPEAHWLDLIPDWAKAKRSDPKWAANVPVKPPALPKKAADQLTELKQTYKTVDEKGKAKIPADPKKRAVALDEAVKAMTKAEVDPVLIGHWVTEATYIGESAQYVSARAMAGRATGSNADFLALIQQARNEIQESGNRIDELTDMLEEQGDDMSQALQDELEALTTSGSSGNAAAVLYEIMPGAAEMDANVAIKPWRHNATGVETLDDALTAEGLPYAYIKNPDVVWRNMATNRAMGSMMQFAKAVAEDPDFFRVRVRPPTPPARFGKDYRGNATTPTQFKSEEGFVYRTVAQVRAANDWRVGEYVATHPATIYADSDTSVVLRARQDVVEWDDAVGGVNASQNKRARSVVTADKVEMLGDDGVWRPVQTALSPTEEQPSQFAERILNTSNGLAMKTGYFAVDLSGVEKFDRGVMDRQMVGTLTNWLWEQTGGPGNPQWDDFYKRMTKGSRDKIDKWIAKNRPSGAGEYGWSDAPAMKIGVLKADKAVIADLKRQGPQAVRNWITTKIEKAVAAQEKKTLAEGAYSGGMTRADADRFFATFTEDTDLEKVLGREVTIYGSDYRAYDELLTAHKEAAIAADPVKNGWLAEVGNGAYQWYLWDEYRNVWDPELTVLRQAHDFQPVDIKQLAISDKVHGRAGYLMQGGLPQIDVPTENVKVGGKPGAPVIAGYGMMDPIHTLMQQAGEGKVRGASMFFGPDQQVLIGLSDLRDGTTFQHEIAHALYQRDLNPSQMQVMLDDFNARVGEREVKVAQKRADTAIAHAQSIRTRTGHEVTRDAAEAEAKVARQAVVKAESDVRVAQRAVEKAKEAEKAAEIKAAEAKKAREVLLKTHKITDEGLLREREGVAEAKKWFQNPSVIKPGAEFRLNVGEARLLSDADVASVASRIGPLVTKDAQGYYILRIPKRYAYKPEVAGPARAAVKADQTAMFAASNASRARREAEYALEDARRKATTATTAHAPKRAAADAAQQVWEAAVKDEKKTLDSMVRAASETVGAPKDAVDREVMEHFVDQFLLWKATGKAPNPKLREAFAYFRKWLMRVWDYLKQNPEAKVSDEVTEVFESLFRMPETPQYGFAYDSMQEGLHQSGVTSSRIAEDAAHTNVFFRRRRNLVERSLNHPYLAYYPASYMWGKVMPELFRFLAAEPFGIPAPGGGLLLSQRIWNSVEMQKDSDPEFREYLENHEGLIRGIGMMLPATPFEVPVNDPLWLRRFAKWGLEASDALEEGYDIDSIKDFDPGKVAEDIWTYAAGPIQGTKYVREMVGGAQAVANDALGLEEQESSIEGLATSY